MSRAEQHMYLLRKPKFRGCMLGILLGDCLGKPFIGDDMCIGAVRIYFDVLQNPPQNIPEKIYTCNTALTKCAARCLILKRYLDLGYLVSQFKSEYWNNPARGYSEDHVRMLQELLSDNFETSCDPDRESYSVANGNASAISVAPIALLLKDDYMQLYSDVVKITSLTDAHKLTVHGALLHCVALRECLTHPTCEKVAHTAYIDILLTQLRFIETSPIPGIDDPTPYQTQLQKIRRILTKELGNGICRSIGSHEFLRGDASTALHAVPSAIYCYLRAQWPIDEIQVDNPFRRSIQLAISCGGDTSSIAALVGCLAGAHYGDTYISEQLRNPCEFVSGMIEIADALFELSK